MTICYRALCLHNPGQAIPGVPHQFRYTGRVPMTGVLRCYLCGRVKLDDDSQREAESQADADERRYAGP